MFEVLTVVVTPAKISELPGPCPSLRDSHAFAVEVRDGLPRS